MIHCNSVIVALARTADDGGRTNPTRSAPVA